MSCKQFQKGEKMFRVWAEQRDQNQQNAQKCPRCKVYISRNGGCPHMIFTGITTLAIPIAIVGAVVTVAVGTRIAVPSYGTYRLIKHIRSKRYEHHQRETISRQWTTRDIAFQPIAIQASLVIFREEIIRRENTSYQNNLYEDDNDHNSFDE
ncbi:hypothetical protein I4U23_010718 [Adineta vaga]|nr:hypothetical protein I4U23_010718 [Adineta vaga]